MKVVIRGLPAALMRTNQEVITRQAQDEGRTRILVWLPVAMRYDPVSLAPISRAEDKAQSVTMSVRPWAEEGERWLVVEPATDEDRAAISRWAQAQEA